MNILRNNNKNKSLLINQLKINKKTIKLLGLLFKNKNENKHKSITSRNNNNLILNKKYNISSNIFPNKILKLPENAIILGNNTINPIIEESLTERNYLNNFGIKDKNKSRNKKMIFNKSDIDNEQKYFYSTENNSKKNYTVNLNKYKNIFDKIFYRIESSYKHYKSFDKKKDFKNYNIVKNRRKKSLTQLNKAISETKIGLNNNIHNKYCSLPTFEDYKNILEKEFNCKELIQIENSKIKQKLKLLKSNIYKKTPIYKSTEKLNTHLIRQFNLDESDLKNCFNKKYKIYRESVNKILEIRKQNLYQEFKENNPYEKNILNLDKDTFSYNNKNEITTNKDVKNALNKYYNEKAKNILDKKLEIERELINLKTEFKNKEKDKNKNNINYDQLNQIIQTKLLYKEIYETDINKKKQQFYDEQTEMLHKVRKWNIPSKVVKLVLKQKTINKFKTNIGAYLGSSK